MGSNCITQSHHSHPLKLLKLDKGLSRKPYVEKNWSLALNLVLHFCNLTKLVIDSQEFGESSCPGYSKVVVYRARRRGSGFRLCVPHNRDFEQVIKDRAKELNLAPVPRSDAPNRTRPPFVSYSALASELVFYEWEDVEKVVLADTIDAERSYHQSMQTYRPEAKSEMLQLELSSMVDPCMGKKVRSHIVHGVKPAWPAWEEVA